MTDQQIERMLHLRRVYDTPDGREELCEKMAEYVFSTIRLGDDENLIRRNDFLYLLEELGALTDKNIPVLVDKLMDIDYMIKED